MPFGTVLRRALAILAFLACSNAVHAQLFRAYVASDGSDANPCTLPQPCRLLPAALAAVASGGEIWMLDSANYNSATVVVGKSVTILAIPGAVGSVVALGGPAISITDPGLNVSLRNLVIVPFPGSGATNGVNLFAASSLTISGSVIANLPLNGVNVASAFSSLKLTDTIVQNCGQRGVLLEAGANAEISGVRLLGNGLGGVLVSSLAGNTTTASVSDSVVSGPSPAGMSVGIAALSDFGGSALVSVTRSTIQGHFYAISSAQTGSVSALSISYSMIFNNANKWYQTGALRSSGNNQFVDNAATGVGVIALTPME